MTPVSYRNFRRIVRSNQSILTVLNISLPVIALTARFLARGLFPPCSFWISQPIPWFPKFDFFTLGKKSYSNHDTLTIGRAQVVCYYICILKMFICDFKGSRRWRPLPKRWGDIKLPRYVRTVTKQCYKLESFLPRKQKWKRIEQQSKLGIPRLHGLDYYGRFKSEPPSCQIGQRKDHFLSW